MSKKGLQSFLSSFIYVGNTDLKCYISIMVILACLQNQQPGAEEAFKILGHAFDLIGDQVS